MAIMYINILVPQPASALRLPRHSVQLSAEDPTRSGALEILARMVLWKSRSSIRQ